MLNTERYGLTALFCLLFLSIPPTVTASDIPQNGLIVEYLFDDSASPGKDTSPNAKHATVNGSPTVTSGKIGQALVIDEFSDVLENIPGFNKGQMTTFNLWLKTSKGGHFMQQSYWQTRTVLWEMLPTLKADSGNMVAWAFGYNGSRDDFDIRDTSKSFNDNQWHMLTIITDGNSGKAYVDGKFYGEDTSSIGPSSWAHNQSLSKTRLGGVCIYAHDGCRQGKVFFDGLIDNYRMYNRALTEAEITALHNEGSLPANLAPVATADSFSLKDTDGVTELDILANDTDEDKANLAVTITNQSGLGGSATVSGQKISYTPQAGYAGEDWVEYRLADKQGLTSEVVRVTLTLTATTPPAANSCPSGYIPVPGNSELGTQDFCVAQYEMKKSSASQPVSQAAGLPWTNLTAAEAFNQCQAITVSGFDGKFQLISNPQWMTVARNLESVNANWSSGVVGNGMFARGHSDSNPNVALSVSNSNDPYDQTGNNSGQAANSGWEQKRRNQLTNGEYIWDLGGNVHELVDWHLNDNSYTAPPSGCTDAGGSSGWNEMNETVTGCSAQDKDIKPKNTSFTSATGMGQWYGGNAGVAFRGGKMSNGIETGIFQLAMYYGKANGDVGFRCSYTPKGAEPANQAPVATADSFSLKDTDGVTELDILANDTDEDKASLAVTITNQSGVGGSATVAGQKISYTPQAGYAGEDWVEYRLTDKQGLTSKVVRATISITTTSSADPLRQGLVAEYLFEDSANPGKDTSSNAYHVSASGTPTLGEGKIGQALLVDELSDVLEGVPGFDKGQMTTFNLWFKTSVGGYLMQQSYWGGGMWELFPASRDEYEGMLDVWAFGYGAGRDDLELEKRDIDLRDNQWHMLTIITDGNSGKVYLDNVLIAEDSSSKGPSSWSAGQASSLTKLGGACIYAHDSCSQKNKAFNGLIDNYRMYSRALTEAEITQLFNETLQVQNQAPVAQADSFTLANTSGVTELDILANDTDEDKANLAVTITNQSGVGGSATVAGQKISYTPQAGYAGEDWVEYRLADKQGLTSEVVRVTLTLTAIVPPAAKPCPTGYIPVPGNSELGTQDFCVAKYEMRKSDSGAAVSTPQGMAWHSISADNAFNSCKAITESGYSGTFSLISNPQWMTIARNIESTGSNWSGGSVGNGHLNRGWSANIPNTPSDPFSNTQRAPHSEGSCEYNTAVDTCGTKGLHKFKRTFSLDNGYVLWDLAGNVGEWVDWQANDAHYSSGPTDAARSFMEVTQLSGSFTKNDLSPKGNYNHQQNMGRWYGGSASGMYRGEYESGGDYAGIYALKHSSDKSQQNPWIGFRCVYNLAESEDLLTLPPVALADSFTLTNTAEVTELDILANDLDEDKASLVITITNQSGVGGSATVSGQKLSYTPQVDYVGEDWIEYRLTDKQGLTSEVARVSLKLQGKLSADIFSDGLVAEYLFEDAAASQHDNSANRHHAAVQKQANSVAGKIGQAIEISETSQVLTAIPGFDKEQEVSFNLWFKTSKGGNLMQQEYWRKGYLTEVWALLPSVREDNGKLQIWAFGYGFDRHSSGQWKRDDFDLAVSDKDFRDNQWHMLTIVTDGRGGRAYIDGELYGQDSFSFGPTGWSKNQTDSKTRLGGACIYAHDGCSGGNKFFQGALDNFRMYNKALTEVEIKRLYREIAGDVNQAPVAKADNLFISDLVNVSTLDILANDWDEAPGSLSVRITAQGSQGGAVAVNGSRLSYTPVAGYRGNDWFEYQLTDSAGLVSEAVRVDLTLDDAAFGNGLAVEYLFEDPADPGRDTSGKAVNATVAGSPATASGKVGQSLAITQLSDVLTKVPGFSKGQMTSFNLWFKTAKGGYLMQQSYWVHNNSAPVWEFIPSVRKDNGRLDIWAYGWVGTGRDDFLIAVDGKDYRDNQWHMLTVITDGVSGKAYIDGQLYGADDRSLGPWSWESNQVTAMTKVGGACVYGSDGCRQGDNPFDGYIDNYRMYNKALTEAEIQALYRESTENLPNFPVKAEADSYQLDWNKSQLLDVLANDTSPGAFSLKIWLKDEPAKGKVSIQDGKIAYVPDADAYGKDKFSYQIQIGSVFSNITQVDLEIFKGIASKPVLEPGGNQAAHRHIHYKGTGNDKIYVEIKSPDQDVTFKAVRTLWDAANNPQRETSEGKNFGYIVERRTRLEVMAFGEGYRDSDVNIVDYYYIDPLQVQKPVNNTLVDGVAGCQYDSEVGLTGGYSNANVTGVEGAPDWMHVGIAHLPNRVKFNGKPQEKDVTAQPLELKINVIDGFNSKQSFNVKVNVKAGNRIPVVNSVTGDGGTSFTTKQAVVINADVSDPDTGQQACGGDKIKQVSFRVTKEGAPAGAWQQVTTAPWRFDFGQLAAGKYVVEVRAEDGADALSAIQSLNIEVKHLPGALKFGWSKGEVFVGESSKLEWQFEAGKVCKADAATQTLLGITDKSGVAKGTESYTSFKPGEYKAVWLCTGESQPIEASLRVKKLSAPANLRKQ